MNVTADLAPLLPGSLIDIILNELNQFRDRLDFIACIDFIPKETPAPFHWHCAVRSLALVAACDHVQGQAAGLPKYITNSYTKLLQERHN